METSKICNVLVYVIAFSLVLLDCTAAQVCDQPDTLDNCKIVENNTYFCYTIENVCCQTCRLFYKNISGCEYGDHTISCRVENCTFPNGTLYEDYKNVCCETCSNVTETTTTSTTPTMMTTVTTITTNTTYGQQNTTLCLNPTGTYYALPCSSIKWESSLCEDPVFNFHCCQNCTVTPTTPPTTVIPPTTKMCLKPSAKYPNNYCGYLRRTAGLPTDDFCSLPFVGSRCCIPCPDWTIKKECQNSSRTCPIMVRIVPELICRYDICCESCKKIKKSIRNQKLLSMLRQLYRLKNRLSSKRRRVVFDD